MESAARTSALPVGLSILGIQLIDVALHVVTDQVERIRVLSNVVIGAWALWSLQDDVRIRPAGFLAIAVYVGLNLVFPAMNGLTNPDKGDVLRVTLFVLVGLTTGLVLWSLSRRRGG